MKKLLIILVILGCAGGAGWWGYKAWRKKQQVPEPPYSPVKVERGPLRETVRATGSVRPQNRERIGSPVAGRVEAIYVDEGDKVAKGQVLALVSSTDRAALMDAALAHGTGELARWETIYKPTPVVSPIDGEVIARKLEPGQTITSDKDLLILSDQLIVDALVDETDLAKIHEGQAAEIELDSYPTNLLPARVDQVAFEAETVNNVTIYHAEVAPLRRPPFLRSGMTASVQFQVAETNSALRVPISAIKEDALGGKTVLVDGPDTNRVPRDVKTGLSDGKNVEIVEGLREGETVYVLRNPAMEPASTNVAKSSPLVPMPRFGGRRPPPPR